MSCIKEERMDRKWYDIYVDSYGDISVAAMYLSPDELTIILRLGNELDDAGCGYPPKITVRDSNGKEVTCL